MGGDGGGGREKEKLDFPPGFSSSKAGQAAETRIVARSVTADTYRTKGGNGGDVGGSGGDGGGNARKRMHMQRACRGVTTHVIRARSDVRESVRSRETFARNRILRYGSARFLTRASERVRASVMKIVAPRFMGRSRWIACSVPRGSVRPLIGLNVILLLSRVRVGKPRERKRARCVIMKFSSRTLPRIREAHLREGAGGKKITR